MKNSLPEIVRRTLMNKRSLLVAERVKLDKDIADLDSVLNPDEAVHDTPASAIQMSKASLADTSISRQIIETAKAMIVPGAAVTTEKILEAILATGAQFPKAGKPPLMRVTRVVSATRLYKGHKSKGWSLKENDPVGAGS